MQKNLISTAELARILGISRVAVFKKIKKGEISAEKIGRNFVIRSDEIPKILGKSLSESKKKYIEDLVKTIVGEYRETFKKLGKE
jgi:excisionase family DNA binding protein